MVILLEFSRIIQDRFLMKNSLFTFFSNDIEFIDGNSPIKISAFLEEDLKFCKYWSRFRGFIFYIESLCGVDVFRIKITYKFQF